ncbi:fimbrial protein [Salmonella enterica subsp. enterica]|nr:fimbrial protein [Salmonella enterica subsp. enterica]EDU8877082.1 fimbrial protein [Salmonella enterica subsp. enterica]
MPVTVCPLFLPIAACFKWMCFVTKGLQMRKQISLLLAGMGILVSGPLLAFTHAPTNMCTANGGTFHSTLPFYGKNISVTQNREGNLVDFETDNGGQYAANCTCVTHNSGTFDHIYYTSVMSAALGETTRTMNRVNYYHLNDNLDVGLGIEIYGRGYVNAPFSYVMNSHPSFEYYNCKDGYSGVFSFDSGSKAKIYFYITQAFIGTITIPPTLIARLYATINSTASIDYSQPVADIYIAGDITAPQECTINGGQVIEVDFGKIPASEFSSTPGTALSDRKIPVKASVSCTGMADGQDVEVLLHATQAGSLPTVIETTNPDVGIKMYDEYNKEVDVNGGRMETDMGTRSRLGREEGEFNFSAAPTSATGTRPQPSKFDANVTITMEIKN